MLAMTCALLGSACASILNPHPPPDPDNLDLSERRAQNRSIVADPDPAPLSAWQWGPDAGAPPASPALRAERKP
ncbi:MAG: hypothetical protein QM820_64770 [Minicystis sp.]